MLPNVPPGQWSPTSTPFARPQPQTPSAEARPVLAVALADAELDRMHVDSYSRRVARTTGELLALLSRERPAAIVLDADLAAVDAAAVFRAARAHEATSLMAILSAPESAPALIKAGCHALLLRPYAPNLFAARLGRLVRERSQQLRLRALRPLTAQEAGGIHRAWPGVTCPRCQEPNATGFEFSSYRRMWFACLACDQVWLGTRPE
jgi:DNA-binding response OmpR family regulator